MPRWLVPLLLAGALVMAVPTAAAARFTSGVQAGDVRSTSAILWARPGHGGRVRLLLARDRRFRRGTLAYAVRSRKSDDHTVRRRVRGLQPGRRYWFRFLSPGRGSSRLGTFKTAPGRKADEVVEFAWTGDTDFSRSRFGGYRWNSGGVFRRMRRERNDFNVHLGDTIYAPPGNPESVEPRWNKYRRNLRNPHLAALRRTSPLYSHWGDHEFIDNFSRKENVVLGGETLSGERLFAWGARAFLDYSPAGYSRGRGLYRSFRWGQNLELFFLDERSFRDPSAEGACTNPRTGMPDVAPTAPQRVRDGLAPALPAAGLTERVSQACLNRIRDPSREMLGQAQFDRFTAAIDRSTARWKIVMNELPIQQFYVLPFDRWEGYEAERQRLLGFLRRNVANVIFLAADAHAVLAGDARLQTLEPGGPVDSGIPEVIAGPAASVFFSALVDRQAGSPGAGRLIDETLLAPPPPDGLGMRCSIVDAFSYGQVRVTRDRLKVTPKGIDGRPLPGCPPIVLRHS